MKLLSLRLLVLSGLAAASFTVAAAEITIPMAMATDSGPGAAVGTVAVTESPYGVVFTPNLTGLPPGLHGFHLHEGGSCGPSSKDGKTVPAGAAGGHYDPAATKAHGTPWGEGHKGDLPPLYVDADGKATQPVLAPRLKLAEIPGHALMVHANGDNHSDHPAPLGGGGGRIACGVAP
jgi:Cu-Zn family superoxide dismutase